MRKYIRSMFRAEAKKNKTNISRWVAAAWEYYKNGTVGATERKLCQARGTHKKSLWRSREALFARR